MTPKEQAVADAERAALGVNRREFPKISKVELAAFSGGPATRSFLHEPIRKPPHIQSIDDNLASEFYKRLGEYIKHFEESLDEQHEVGVRLVSFGQSITFHVASLGYYNPSLISFNGRMDDGAPVQLVQHVSQISFLLTALERLDPTKPKQRFGFAQEPEDTHVTPSD